jgi:hypothetical protein
MVEFEVGDVATGDAASLIPAPDKGSNPSWYSARVLCTRCLSEPVVFCGDCIHLSLNTRHVLGGEHAHFIDGVLPVKNEEGIPTEQYPLFWYSVTYYGLIEKIQKNLLRCLSASLAQAFKKKALGFFNFAGEPKHYLGGVAHCLCINPRSEPVGNAQATREIIRILGKRQYFFDLLAERECLLIVLREVKFY